MKNMAFQLASPFIDDYLKQTDIIDYDHPNITALIESLDIRTQSELEKVRVFYEFVRDEVTHSWDEQTHVVTKKASEVAKHKTGICYAKANLLAALLRKEGIPSGFCYQRLLLFDEPAQGFYLHAFNAAFLSSLNRWIYMDARGNVATALSIDEPALAYTPDESVGEKTYETVFAEPNEKTMNALAQADDALDMYMHQLPDAL